VPRCAFSSRAGEPHLGDTRANGSVFWLVSMLPFGALGEGPKGSERQLGDFTPGTAQNCSAFRNGSVG
jgi:hypothetical protein